MYHVFEHYLEKLKRHSLMPLAVDVITPGDYHLYLVSTSSQEWYVVTEADYLTMRATAMDIENTFPVKPVGWCVLKKYQDEAGTNLLSADADDYDPDGTNDTNYNNRRYTVYSEFGMSYALLRVEPKPGVSFEDFGLRYFEEKH